MKRNIMSKLLDWKISDNRKPLLLRGARQVGKTYILKEFGNNNYENVAYFNFDHDDDLKNIFVHTKNPKRIIEQLSFALGKAITKGSTLIILDEIQECPDALNSLKYFCEEENEYHIVCAGSLLGIKLSHTSFPVGKVNFLDMYPMTFKEFLEADGCNNLIQYLDSINDIVEISDLFSNLLEEKLKAYFIVGGMPEVVYSWINKKDITEVNTIQDNIIEAYKSDFGKHSTDSDATKISYIWDSIPSQLARENKKFVYQTVKNGARAREYENSLNWLHDANLIYKINSVTIPELPISAYRDLSSFKIYFNDVGLLRSMSNLDSRIVIQGDSLFQEFKGALTENYVLEMLATIYDDIHYFTFDKHEVDFMIQTKNKIIPIEVKSNLSVNSISLKKYNEKYNPKYRVRFSMKNLSYDGNLLNVPLYMVEYLPKLIDIIESK